MEQRKIVSKDQVLLKNVNGVPLPIDIETVLPVKVLDDESEGFMQLKVLPLKRSELAGLNDALLNEKRRLMVAINEAKDAKEKLEAEIAMETSLALLKRIQEEELIVQRIIEPKFTKADYDLLPQSSVDALFYTVMCASGLPKKLFDAIGRTEDK